MRICLDINWQDVCKQMLEKQQDLTTNYLVKQGHFAFDIDDIHVPLALVKRKDAPKPKPNSPLEAEESSRLYQSETTQEERLEYQQFLTQLWQPQQGENQNIAVIGEPGAGKTTLLQKVGLEICQHTDKLPIFIPLAQLIKQEKSILDYLTNIWLKTAVPDANDNIENDLKKHFKEGRIYLLLDGLDEIGLTEKPLEWLKVCLFDRDRLWLVIVFLRSNGKRFIYCG
jgi:hypothetical protein